MAHIVEPTLREILWDWLEQRGYEVAGEVPIGGGKIDLLARSPDGEYHGYEVKDQKKLERDVIGGLKPDEIDDVIEQLNRYRESKYLDRLYFCSQNPLSVSKELEGQESRIDIEAMNRQRGLPSLDNSPMMSVPQGLGFIRVPFDVTNQDDPEMVKGAEHLGKRVNQPNIPRNNEAWVCHYVWKELFGAIREAELPNPESKTAQRIDVVTFEGTPMPTDIYESQENNEIIGVEAKGAGIGNPSEVRSQLTRYLNCGGLTALYLAVLEQDIDKATKILAEQPTLDSFGASDSRSTAANHRSLTDIGLIAVDSTGDTEFIHQAQKLRLRYDGLNLEGGCGSCNPVAWGRITWKDCEEFHSVFRQA